MSPKEIDSSGWRVVGRSVQGATHRRRRLPNQDAVAWWPTDGGGAATALAVADGHGNAGAPRSANGSRCAVEVMVQVLRETVAGGISLTELQQAAAALPAVVVERWRKAVLNHEAADPLPESANEIGGLVDRDIYTAYGTTLLGVAATAEALLLLQIGDGDILVVDDERVVMRPVPVDTRLVLNETTSLGGARAATDFRWNVISMAEPAPRLVLASTDGYANSFRDDLGFCQVGSDLLALIRSEGLDAVAANLETWLDEASRQGSGDDVTVALLYRDDLAKVT